MDQRQFRGFGFRRQRFPDIHRDLCSGGPQRGWRQHVCVHDGDGEPAPHVYSDPLTSRHQPGRRLHADGKLQSCCDVIRMDQFRVRGIGLWRQRFSDFHRNLFRGGPKRGRRRSFGVRDSNGEPASHLHADRVARHRNQFGGSGSAHRELPVSNVLQLDERSVLSRDLVR